MTARRGVVYTITALVLLAVIGGLLFAHARRSGHEVSVATQDRVRSLDSFLTNMGEDSERAAYIAGFRTLIAMEQHVASTGEFIDDPDATFKEIFVTGNLSNESFVIMQNSSFGEYLGRVHDEAAVQGIVVQAAVGNVTLWQVDAWSLLVNYTLALNVSDSRNTANWSVTRTFTGRIPVNDLRDPLFTASTFSRIQRVIRQTNITGFVNDAGNANDTSGFMYHFNNSLYVANGRGPSLLMRFAGNLSDSPYGIESVLDTEEFIAQTLAVNSTSSVIDYQYFNGTTATVCTIQNMPATIKLDAASLTLYGISGTLTYGVCP